MKARNLFIAVTIACIVAFGAASYANWWPFGNKSVQVADNTELTVVYWDDLIPDDFVQPKNPFATMSQDEVDKLLDGSDESNRELERLEKEFNYAPVVKELDGKRVKIPAYITPLDFDGNTRLSEFLLVPYVGACIHTPPPPANQVVHAKSPTTIEVSSLYDPVWVIGTIRAETIKSDLAESGYQLDVEEVTPYTEPEAQ